MVKCGWLWLNVDRQTDMAVDKEHKKIIITLDRGTDTDLEENAKRMNQPVRQSFNK